MRTLVDCGCEAKVYADGSGVELYHCPLHAAAEDLLKALELAEDIAKAGIRQYGDPYTVQRFIDIAGAAHSAIQKARGK